MDSLRSIRQIFSDFESYINRIIPHKESLPTSFWKDLRYLKSEFEFVKNTLSDQTTKSYDHEALKVLIKHGNLLHSLINSDPLNFNHISDLIAEVEDEISDLRVRFINSVQKEVRFYFKITSDGAESSHFTLLNSNTLTEFKTFHHNFERFDLRNKVFQLFGKTVLAEKNIGIILEADIQNPVMNHYFIRLWDQKFIEILPNSEDTRYEIKISPIEAIFLQPLEYVYPIQDAVEDIMMIRIDRYTCGFKNQITHTFIEEKCSYVAKILSSYSAKSIHVFIRDKQYPYGIKVPVSLEIDNVDKKLGFKSVDLNYMTGELIELTTFMWVEVEIFICFKCRNHGY